MKTFFQNTLFLIALLSCSHQPIIKYKNNHKKYLQSLRYQEETLSPKSFQLFVKKEIQKKESELINIEGIKEGARLRHTDSEAAQERDFGDIKYFKANSAKIELHQLESRKKLIKKEIFFLRSKLLRQ